MVNPFSTMFRYRAAQTPLQLLQCLGHKIIDDSDNVTFGMEYPRQMLIDYYSPKERNREFDLDSAKFYYYRYEDKLGIKFDFWVGVTLTENIVMDMSHVLPGVHESLYILSKCSVDIAENTIKTCSVLNRFYMLAIRDVIGNSNYGVNSAVISVHTLANYLYRAFDIDISDKESFLRVAPACYSSNGRRANVFYEFFKQDFKYCKTISRDDLSYPKVIGSYERYANTYGHKSKRCVIVNKSGDVTYVNKETSIDPDKKKFDLSIYGLTYDDVSSINKLAIEGASAYMHAHGCDDDDIDEVAVALDEAFLYPRTGNINVSNFEQLCYTAISGLALISSYSYSGVGDMYQNDDLKKIIQYVRCIASLIDDTNVFDMFCAKLRASMMLGGITATYYCYAIDTLLDIIESRKLRSDIVSIPSDEALISNVINLNNTMADTTDDDDWEAVRQSVENPNCDADVVCKFLFNAWPDLGIDETPYDIGCRYSIRLVKAVVDDANVEEEDEDESDAEDTI